MTLTVPLTLGKESYILQASHLFSKLCLSLKFDEIRSGSSESIWRNLTSDPDCDLVYGDFNFGLIYHLIMFYRFKNLNIVCLRIR